RPVRPAKCRCCPAPAERGGGQLAAADQLAASPVADADPPPEPRLGNGLLLSRADPDPEEAASARTRPIQRAVPGPAAQPRPANPPSPDRPAEPRAVRLP